jgi:hypothetical protein
MDHCHSPAVDSTDVVGGCSPHTQTRSGSLQAPSQIQQMEIDHPLPSSSVSISTFMEDATANTESPSILGQETTMAISNILEPTLFLFLFILNQQFITRCSIAVHGKPYKREYSLRVYTCKIGRDTTALTSPFRAVMSPAHASRGQENDKEYWALRRLPKPALAPDRRHPQHVQSTPKDVPSRSRTRV